MHATDFLLCSQSKTSDSSSTPFLSLSVLYQQRESWYADLAASPKDKFDLNDTRNWLCNNV